MHYLLVSKGGVGADILWMKYYGRPCTRADNVSHQALVTFYHFLNIIKMANILKLKSAQFLDIFNIAKGTCKCTRADNVSHQVLAKKSMPPFVVLLDILKIKVPISSLISDILTLCTLYKLPNT